SGTILAISSAYLRMFNTPWEINFKTTLCKVTLMLCKAGSVHKIIFTIAAISSMLNSIMTYGPLNRHSKLIFC
ncbi:MAG: hypothetical protein OSA85_09245, partial [Psychrobacter pacificensis]